MNLRAFCHDALARVLAADPEVRLLGDFDCERRAETESGRRSEALTWAYAVHTDFPGNPRFGDDRTWECVLRLFDRVCDWQREDGAWVWFLPRTGKTYTFQYSFSFHLWLRLFEDFSEHMDRARRERVAGMLRKGLDQRMAMAKVARLDLRNRDVGLNILTHYMAQLWHGGRLFDNAAWRDAAAEAFRKIIAHQAADGYWPDSKIPRGPVVMYNTVPWTAWPLMRAFRATPTHGPRRCGAAEFHQHFYYPDGRCVETIDERNRLRDARCGPFLLPNMAAFAETRPFAPGWRSASTGGRRRPTPPRCGAWRRSSARRWRTFPRVTRRR